MKVNILTLDTSPTIAKVLKIAFTRFDVELLFAKESEEALRIVELQTIHLVIIDAKTAHLNDELKKTIQIINKKVSANILLCSSYESGNKKFEQELGAYNILPKPFSVKELFSLISALDIKLSPRTEEIQHEEKKAPPPANSIDFDKTKAPPKHLITDENSTFKTMLSDLVREEVNKKLPGFIENFCQKNFKKEVSHFLKKELDHIIKSKNF